jgi:hypothetical protein
MEGKYRPLILKLYLGKAPNLEDVWEAVEVKIQKILIPGTRYGKWSTGCPWLKEPEVSLYKKNVSSRIS